jgi:hypothetical protein
MKTPLFLSLCLILASTAAEAQSGGTQAPSPAPANPPATSPAPAASPAPVSHPTGPQAFWGWFVGSDSWPGAYKAPEMPCSTVSQINGQNALVPKGSVEDRGQRYFASFILSMGANPVLCRNASSPAVPAEAMLPTMPPVFNEWIAGHDQDQAVRGAMLDYIQAPGSVEDTVGRMRRDRVKFWRSALAAVMADDEARSEVCAKAMPGAASCASTIAAKTPEELYQLGRDSLPRP